MYLIYVVLSPGSSFITRLIISISFYLLIFYFISRVTFLVDFRLIYFCDCFVGRLGTAAEHPWSPSLSLHTAGRNLPSLSRT